MGRVGLKPIAPIAPYWAPRWNDLLSAVQVHITTHCRLHREQLGPSPPKTGPQFGGTTGVTRSPSPPKTGPQFGGTTGVTRSLSLPKTGSQFGGTTGVTRSNKSEKDKKS